MKELIQALETIKREAGSHTVSVDALRPAHGFGFIYDVASKALAKYASQPAVKADAEIDGVCTCHWALNFKPRVCSTCGKRTA